LSFLPWLWYWLTAFEVIAVEYIVLGLGSFGL